MKLCPKCGKEVGENANFCSLCSSGVEVRSTSTTSEAPGTTLILAGGILLLVFAIILLFPIFSLGQEIRQLEGPLGLFGFVTRPVTDGLRAIRGFLLVMVLVYVAVGGIGIALRGKLEHAKTLFIIGIVSMLVTFPISLPLVIGAYKNTKAK